MAMRLHLGTFFLYSAVQTAILAMRPGFDFQEAVRQFEEQAGRFSSSSSSAQGEGKQRATLKIQDIEKFEVEQISTAEMMRLRTQGMRFHEVRHHHFDRDPSGPNRMTASDSHGLEDVRESKPYPASVVPDARVLARALLEKGAGNESLSDRARPEAECVDCGMPGRSSLMETNATAEATSNSSANGYSPSFLKSLRPSQMSGFVCVQFDLDLTYLTHGAFPGMFSVGLMGDIHYVSSTKCWGWSVELNLMFSMGIEIAGVSFRLAFVFTGTVVVNEQPLGAAADTLSWDLPYRMDTTRCHTSDPFTLIEKTFKKQWKYILVNLLARRPTKEEQVHKAIKKFDEKNSFADYIPLLGRHEKPASNLPRTPIHPESGVLGQPLVTSFEGGAIELSVDWSPESNSMIASAKLADVAREVAQARISLYQDWGKVIVKQISARAAAEKGSSISHAFSVKGNNETVIGSVDLYSSAGLALQEAGFALTTTGQQSYATTLKLGVREFFRGTQGTLAVQSVSVGRKQCSWSPSTVTVAVRSAMTGKSEEATWTSDMFGDGAPWGVNVDIWHPIAGIPDEAAPLVSHKKPIVNLLHLEWYDIHQLLTELPNLDKYFNPLAANVRYAVTARSLDIVDMIELQLLKNFLVELLWKGKDRLLAKSSARQARPDPQQHVVAQLVRARRGRPLHPVVRSFFSELGLRLPDDVRLSLQAGSEQWSWRHYSRRTVNAARCAKVAADLISDPLAGTVSGCEDKCRDLRPAECRDGDCRGSERQKPCNVARLDLTSAEEPICTLWHCLDWKNFPVINDEYHLSALIPGAASGDQPEESLLPAEEVLEHITQPLLEEGVADLNANEVRDLLDGVLTGTRNGFPQPASWAHYAEIEEGLVEATWTDEVQDKVFPQRLFSAPDWSVVDKRKVINTLTAVLAAIDNWDNTSHIVKLLQAESTYDKNKLKVKVSVDGETERRSPASPPSRLSSAESDGEGPSEERPRTRSSPAGINDKGPARRSRFERARSESSLAQVAGIHSQEERRPHRERSSSTPTKTIEVPEVHPRRQRSRSSSRSSVDHSLLSRWRSSSRSSVGDSEEQRTRSGSPESSTAIEAHARHRRGSSRWRSRSRRGSRQGSETRRSKAEFFLGKEVATKSSRWTQVVNVTSGDCEMEVHIQWGWQLTHTEMYFRRPKLVGPSQALFAAYDQFVSKLPAYSAQVEERLRPNPADSNSKFERLKRLKEKLPYSTTDGRFLHRNLKKGEQESLKVSKGDLGTDDAVFNFPKAMSRSKFRGTPHFAYNAGLSAANLFLRIVSDVQALFFLYFANHPDWDGKCQSLPANFHLFYEYPGGDHRWGRTNWDPEDVPRSSQGWLQRHFTIRLFKEKRRTPLPELTHRAGASVGEVGARMTEDDKALFTDWHWISKPHWFSNSKKRASFMTRTPPTHGKDGWATDNVSSMSAVMWPHIWCELVDQFWVKRVSGKVANNLFALLEETLGEVWDLMSTAPTERGPYTEMYFHTLKNLMVELPSERFQCPPQEAMRSRAVAKAFVDRKLKEFRRLATEVHRAGAQVYELFTKTVSFLKRDLAAAERASDLSEEDASSIKSARKKVESADASVHQIIEKHRAEDGAIDRMSNAVIRTWESNVDDALAQPATVAQYRRQFWETRKEMEMSMDEKSQLFEGVQGQVRSLLDKYPRRLRLLWERLRSEGGRPQSRGRAASQGGGPARRERERGRRPRASTSPDGRRVVDEDWAEQDLGESWESWTHVGVEEVQEAGWEDDVDDSALPGTKVKNDIVAAFQFTDQIVKTSKKTQEWLLGYVELTFACIDLALRPQPLADGRFKPWVSAKQKKREDQIDDILKNTHQEEVTGLDFEGIDLSFDLACRVPPDSNLDTYDRDYLDIYSDGEVIVRELPAEPRPECERVVLSKHVMAVLPSFARDVVANFTQLESDLVDLKESLTRPSLNASRSERVESILKTVRGFVQGLKSTAEMDADFYTAFAYKTDGALFGDMWASLKESSANILTTLQARTSGRRDWIRETIRDKALLKKARRVRVRKPEPPRPEIPTEADGCVCKEDWSAWVWYGRLPKRRSFRGCVRFPRDGKLSAGKNVNTSEWKGVCKTGEKRRSIVKCSTEMAPCDPNIAKDTRPEYKIWRKGEKQHDVRPEDAITLPLVQTDAYMSFAFQTSRADFCTPGHSPLKIMHTQHWSVLSWVPWEIARSSCFGARVHPPGFHVLLLRCKHRELEGTEELPGHSIEWRVVFRAYLLSYSNTWGTGDGDEIGSWFNGGWTQGKFAKNWAFPNVLTHPHNWANHAGGYGYLQTSELMNSGSGFWFSMISEALNAFSTSIAASRLEIHDGSKSPWRHRIQAIMTTAASVIWSVVKKFGAVPLSWGLTWTTGQVAKALQQAIGIKITPWRNEHDVVLVVQWAHTSRKVTRNAPELFKGMRAEQIQMAIEHPEMPKLRSKWDQYQTKEGNSPNDLDHLSRSSLRDIITRWVDETKSFDDQGIEVRDYQPLWKSCARRPRWFSVSRTDSKTPTIMYPFYGKNTKEWFEDRRKYGQVLFLIDDEQGDGWFKEINSAADEDRFYPVAYFNSKALRVKYDTVEHTGFEFKQMTNEEFDDVMHKAALKDLLCWARVAHEQHSTLLPSVQDAVREPTDYPDVSLPATYYSDVYAQSFLQELWQSLPKTTKEHLFKLWFNRGKGVKPKVSGTKEVHKFRRWSWGCSLILRNRIGLPFVKVPKIAQIEPWAEFSIAWDVKAILRAIWARIVSFVRSRKKKEKSMVQSHKMRISKCRDCIEKGEAFCDRYTAANSMLKKGWDSSMDRCEEKTFKNKNNICRNFVWEFENHTDWDASLVFKNQVCPCYSQRNGEQIEPRWITSLSGCDEMQWPTDDSEDDRRQIKAADWRNGFGASIYKTQNLKLADTMSFDRAPKGCEPGFKCCGSLAKGKEIHRCVELAGIKKMAQPKGFMKKLKSKLIKKECKAYKPDLKTDTQWTHAKQEFRCSPSGNHRSASSYDGAWRVEDGRWVRVRQHDEDVDHANDVTN